MEAKSVDVTVYDEKKEEKFELELTPKQVRQLKTLIEENTYIRRLSSTIIGVLPDKRYIILANWDDGGKKNLYISLIGGEYIQISGRYGSNYHKIKNTDFERQLLSVLGVG